MAGYDFDVGVIGGGAAGLTVTSGAAQLGAKTLLVERERAWRGLPPLRVCSKQDPDPDSTHIPLHEKLEGIWPAFG